MKITLDLDKSVVARLRREAARRGRNMSELVETALRLLFHSQRRKAELPRLPTYDFGVALVDVADRDVLYDAMEGPSYFERLYGPLSVARRKKQTKC